MCHADGKWFFFHLWLKWENPTQNAFQWHQTRRCSRCGKLQVRTGDI